MPVDITGASGDEVPRAYVSPDVRYTAVLRRDNDRAHINVTTGTREVFSYWIASLPDAEVAVDGKEPARAVEGVPPTVSWPPDSRCLAFGRSSGAPRSLIIVSANGWSQSGFEVQGSYVGELAWAPDSSQLAISTYEIDRSNHDMLMFDVATSTVRDLIDGCSIVWAPNAARSRATCNLPKSSEKPVKSGDQASMPPRILVDLEHLPHHPSIRVATDV